MQKDLVVLESLKLPDGLYFAGASNYNKIWVRDNVYIALAFQEIGNYEKAQKIYSELLKIAGKYKDKLEVKKYPELDSEIIHPRFAIDGSEFHGPWGNRQYDAWGVLLFGIGKMYEVHPVFLNISQKKLVQEIVNFLEVCRYWSDEDNGMWEEDLALHSSSLAACIKGIEAVSGFCKYNKTMLAKAKQSLESLLPKESYRHDVDLALMSLIWPYDYQRPRLVKNVESQLLRDKGVIRYKQDKYESWRGVEQEWVLGVPWLGIAHFELGDTKRAIQYLNKLEHLYFNGLLPEAYRANKQHCPHTPLAWSHAMTLVLKHKLGIKKF